MPRAPTPASELAGTRVLVTGTGGPSGVSFMQALGDDRLEFFSGDIDPYAPGLYLVDAEHRLILRRGDDPCFAEELLALCERLGVDVVVPTVDSELLPLAERRDEYAAAGVRLVLAPTEVLRTCLDKWSLMQAVHGEVPIPPSAPLDDDFDPGSWSLPVLLKPRCGSGSRGIRVIETTELLEAAPRDQGLLVQEYLPGAEHSLDVFAAGTGEVCAVVPRARLKIDSGIAITGRTVHDERLESIGRRAAEVVGITGVANVQVKDDVEGEPRLIEINPRFPGTMPLTVASGVNMPRLALQDALGRRPPPGPLAFREVAMTRHLAGVIVEVEELRDQVAAAGARPEAAIR